ncbi:MAG: helix-turn-helix transcriptional regulator, partial [Actinomadura rubrobrunea]|nr:helix-turn-helix transcriptional regulator [Actinomadura rubrobrunea]
MGSSRAERRRRSEQRILAAARTLFAERGFERTTIRAVAASAGVDPALVMQYFGSKQGLFERAVRASAAPDADHGPDDDVVENFLESLRVKLGGLPPVSQATLRSMLTHPDAAAAARSALTDQIDRLAAALPGDDAALRAALATALMLGVTLGHQMLDLPPLADAHPDEIARLLRPALQT